MNRKPITRPRPPSTELSFFEKWRLRTVARNDVRDDQIEIEQIPQSSETPPKTIIATRFFSNEISHFCTFRDDLLTWLLIILSCHERDSALVACSEVTGCSKDPKKCPQAAMLLSDAVAELHRLITTDTPLAFQVDPKLRNGIEALCSQLGRNNSSPEWTTIHLVRRQEGLAEALEASRKRIEQLLSYHASLRGIIETDVIALLQPFLTRTKLRIDYYYGELRRYYGSSKDAPRLSQEGRLPMRAPSLEDLFLHYDQDFRHPWGAYKEIYDHNNVQAAELNRRLGNLGPADLNLAAREGDY